MKLLKCLVSKRNTSILFSCKRFVGRDIVSSKSTMEAESLSFLHRIPELSKANVIIPNPELVNGKLKKMAEQSNETLQIVTDFDSTLTKPTVNGQPAVGSLEVFKTMDIVPKEFLLKSREDVIGYFTAIRNPKLSKTQVMELTDQFLLTVLKSIKVLPIPDDIPFEEEAAKGIFVLRDDAVETFKMLKDNSVPILVLSGGLCNIINYVLKDQKLLTSNVHVMGNNFTYKDGHIESFDGDIIHFFNKNVYYLKSDIYKKELSKKNNIILIGDAVADAIMTDGVPETFNVLKIGFCHENLFGYGAEEYVKHFDIVVTEDETFSLVKAILKHVLTSA